MRKQAFFITGLNFGGAELAMLKLVATTECPPIVFSLKSGGLLKSQLESKGVRVIELGLNIWNFIRNYQLVLKILDENEIEIICSWLYHADFFVSFLRLLRPKLKLVWTIHNLSVGKDSIKTPTRIIVYLNAIISYMLPHKIIYCALTAQTYHETTLRFNKRISTVINNPILNGDEIKISYSVNNRNAGGCTIGMAARWDPVKNHQLAFLAFSELLLAKPKSELILCGSGMNWENKSLVNMLNKFQIIDNVNLLGTITEMEKFYNGIDILLITSVSEALPNVIVEALLYERPVISVPAGDIPNIIRPLETIVTYDARSIAEKMIMICNNYKASVARVKSFKIQGHLDRYNPERVHSKYCDVFNAL